MGERQLHLHLVLGPNDPPLTDDLCQSGLHRLEEAIRTAGFIVTAAMEAWNSPSNVALRQGEFLVEASTDKSLWLLLSPIVVAWLTRRNGRKVRLKIGEIEAEAQTPEELDKLLAKAQEIQRNNEPKKIYER